MSFKINSDKEQIRANTPSVVGDSQFTIRSGTSSDEKEVVRTLLDPSTKLPRVGINRTGSRIDRIIVTNSGNGYTLQPTVTISAPNDPGGIQALASASLSPEGRLSGVLIDNPGDGYTSAPAISITGGNGQGAAAQTFLDTVDYELDINGAIRTSTSIISDTARILNLDIDNLVTPDAQVRAPNLKTFINNTGTPWSPDRLLQINTFVYRGGNVYQAMSVGTTSNDPLDPPLHIDGEQVNGNALGDPTPGVLFKHVGFRVSDENEAYYNNTGESGIYPRSITPILGDSSDKIATTEYVLNLATNDVGGRIYVSQQIGNDENDGRSAVSPVRTIKKAAQLAWSTPGVKESLIVSGGDYTENNPISLPPDCSIVGDNLRLVIVRPSNPRKHLIKFSDKNYVIGVTYRDQVDSDGFSTFTWDYAMVFDDKQRVTYDYNINGDFETTFPIGHQIFGEDIFRATYQSNGGLANLVSGIELRGVNAGGIVISKAVAFNETTGPSAYQSGTFDYGLVSGSVTPGETLVYGGANSERFQPLTAYTVGTVVWTEDHVYNVSAAGTSGESNPTHDAGAANNGTGTLEFTYLRDTYSLVTTDIISIRAEGEVVETNENITSVLPITRIDFSLQGDPSIATGGFGDAGSAEDLGGIVFYTNPLVEDDNIHDFKEGQEIEISGLSTSAPDLSSLNGKQRIYKVIEDPDGRSRRFVIPKKLPSLTNNNYDPGQFAQVVNYSKSVTLSLLNSPFKFNESTPVARRYQDAVAQIRNNREFIADEVVAKINEQFAKVYYSVYEIGGTTTSSLTPTNATYNSTTGELVFTKVNHGFDIGTGISIADNSLTFTCLMDNNATEHTYPRPGDPASGRALPIISKTDDTFTVNVGISPANVDFTPSSASYNPATGDLLLDIGTHSIPVGGSVTIASESLSFTCDMDNRDTAKQYPRVGIDPYAVRSIPVTSTTTSSITVNIGASPANKYFQPTYAEYDPTTGDMVFTIGQHGLGVGRNITIANDSLTFTCLQDPSAAKTYPRSGIDPYADSKSIAITAVGESLHTPTDAPYDATSGLITFTVNDHGFTTGDYVKIADNSLTYSCAIGGNYTHQFVSATGGAVKSGGNYSHTFVSAVANGVNSNAGNLPNPVTNVVYTPSTGNMVITSNGHGLTTGNTLTIADNALKFTCSMDNNATEHSYPRPSDPVSGQTISITGTTTNTITVNVGSSPIVSHDVSNASYDPYTGELQLTIGSHSLDGQTIASPTTGTTYNPTTGIMSITTDSAHGFVVGDKVKLDDGAVKFSCSYGAGNHNYVGGTATGAVKVVGGNRFDVTNAAYTPTTGELELTIGTHSLSTANKVKINAASLDFECDADNYNTTHSYPRPSDPVAGEEIDVTSVTGTTITVNVGVSSPGTSYPRGPENHTVSDAAYVPASGVMTLTIGAHSLQAGDKIKLAEESLIFECPAAVGTHAFVTGAPSAISGGGSQFTAAAGTTYNPNTGEMVLEIGSHSLTQGNTITMSNGAVTFTCDADNNATNHQYPRATDPVSGENIAITNVSATTITVNVGVASTTNQSAYPRATGANTASGADYAYDNELIISAVTTDSVTVNVNGGQGAISINSVHTFVSGTANGVSTGADPISGKWIQVLAVGSSTSFDIQVLDTVPSTNTDTHTFISGVANSITKKGSSVRLDPESLKFTCDKDGNASQHDYPRATDPAYNTSLDIIETTGTTITLNVGKADVGSSYPRAGFDPISGRWVPITVVDTNTFRISVGDSSYTGTHTFLSASENAISRQDGTITINVGISSNTTAHTFVTAAAQAIRYEPQSTHYFEGSAANAVRFRAQTAHTFVRTTNGNLSTGGNSFKVFLGANRFTHTYVSGGTATFGGVTYNITNFVYDNLITGTAVVTVNASIPNIAEDDTVQLDDILFECDIDGVTTQKKYPSFSIPSGDSKCVRDVKHFINAITADLEFGSNHNTINAAKKYIDATVTKIDFVDTEIIQTVRAMEYARELCIYAMRKWRTGTGLTTDPVYTPVYSSIPRYFDPTIIDDLNAGGACNNVQSAIDTLAYLFVDVLANNASGTYLDAAYLITRNRDHITDEAYRATRNNFPSLVLNNVDERKCRRDINIIISGLIRDLVLGGNIGIVQAAETYYTGNELTGIPASELAPTIYAYNQVKNLCIEAMRNFVDDAGNTTPVLFTSIPRFTDNTILGDPSGNPLCANVQASINTAFALIEDILDGTITKGDTTQTTGTLLDTADLYTYPDSFISDQNNVKIAVRSTYDDYPIIEASPYTQNSSVISKLGGGGALIDGDKVKQPNCPFPGLTIEGAAKFPNQGKSMVASAFTIVSEGGTGYRIINDGYVQLVSVFCIFCADGVLAESGGYASITNSATNFGIFALRARGYSEISYDFDNAIIGNVSSTPTGRTILSVSGLGREPLEHYVVKIDGFENVNPEIEYFVDTVEGVTVGPPFSAQLTLESGSGGPAEFKNTTTDAVVSLASLVGETIRLHRPSIVNSSSHTWEYAGSGTSYLALPENGGVKVEANEQVSENYGRTYVSGTDEIGDFKVGTFARIENRTGNITFTGTVTISEVEFLKLKGGDVVVTGFDNSNTLGGANSSDSKLPTQKAVKDFITNNLGPFINKPYSTNPVPRALVELTDSGKISEDQIPPLRPFQVYTVADQAERVAIEGALAGDIAIQQDITTSFILNNDNESLFVSFAVDSTLQFTIGDIFTGNISGGKIQSTEYRQGVVYQLNIVDGGSGYVTPPIVTVSGNQQAGGVPANITAEIANGQVVILNIELFNTYVGGKGYTVPPTITIAAPAGSGTQATANALIESRVYGDIVNNVKIVDTDTIESSDLPAETININRVINTSASNTNNWVSLSSNQIAATDITSGVISTARLASNASGEQSAANSFTFLRGDQAYAPAVQTLKGPETRYFAKLKIQANSGASQLIFDSSSDFLKGHEVTQITGIQVDTNIDGVLTESGETTITLDKFLTATLPAGTVLEFSRGASPLTFESSQTQGGFVDKIVIAQGGSGFDAGPFFDVPLTGGAPGTGLRANIFTTNGSVTGINITDSGEGYLSDFAVSSSPTEIGAGSGLSLLAKVSTVNRQYANVAIDIQRVSDLTTSGDPYGTLGVSRYLKSQFNIGDAGNGSVSINTGPDSGLDADTLDGAQGTFYLNAGNMNAGFLPTERLSGTYNISISNTSGNTLRLKTADAPLSNPSPDEFSAGIIADTKNNSTDGLSDGGSKHLVMTIRNGGSDFDATYGGVRQLAFTDGTAANGGNMWLRGSFNSPANTFANWYQVWTSGNDGTLSGLDADKMDGRQGTWYQTALHMNYGTLSNERLPFLQSAKDNLNKIRVMDWVGTPRYTILVRDELLNTTPFVSGNSVNLYDSVGAGVGAITLTKVEPTQDVNDAANNYTLLTGSLTTGNFTGAKFIGTGGVANAFEFQDFNLSQIDDNVDGIVDGTYEVIVAESDGGNAKLKLGRDGTASTPSIFFKSSQSTATNYNSAFIAQGGNSTDGSGTLEVKVANSSGFTVLGNEIWNAGTVQYYSANIAPSTDSQGNITVRSAVMRDVNGDFAAGTITANLTGSASNNVLKAGDTMTGALIIGGVATSNQALSVSGRGDFLSNITVAADLTVDTNVFHVDATDDAVGFGTSTPDSGIPIHVFKGSVGTSDITTLLKLETTRSDFIATPGGSQILFKNQDGNNSTNEAYIQAVTVNDTDFGDNDEAATNFIFRQTNAGTAQDNVIFTGDGRVGLGIMNPTERLHVEGNAYVSQALTAIQGITLGTTANNDDAPIYFLGNTGGLVGGGPNQLSNFRVGNGMISNDIFEITANDGSQGPTTWKGTPALAILGTSNRVAINTTTFSGQDNTDPNNIINRDYSLNVEGDLNINNGNLYVDNAPFVTSRWTESSDANSANIYRLSKVGINQEDPTYALHIGTSVANSDASVNIEGTTYNSGKNTSVLHANGDPQYLDSYGVFKCNRTIAGEDTTIPANTNAMSVGTIEIGDNTTITVANGGSWTIV